MKKIFFKEKKKRNIGYEIKKKKKKEKGLG